MSDHHQHSAEYIEYMQSRQWAERKHRLFVKRGYVCEMCNSSGIPLDVHHKNYDRLGCELDDDLLIVCHERCHPKADLKRIEWEQRRIAQRGMRWATLEEKEILTMKIVNRSNP